MNGLVTTGIKVATFGVVAPPTTGSSIENAGKNHYDAARAAEKAGDITEDQR